MSTILVTGGAGFIGSHTCVELLNAGYGIVVMDNFSNSKPEALNRIKKITGKDFKFYETDILDYEGTCKIFLENKIDGVIHFAGLKAVGESCAKPVEYYYNNISGTIELIKAMRDNGCKNMVFSSSATVYGMNNPVPYVETYPTSATNPYGYTKVMIEQILTDTAKADGDWSVALLRYFNPIGAHESGLLGEDPNGIPNNLLPYVAQVAAGKLPCLSVYGDDYDTPDGTGVRDYIHVVDLAKGHLCAVDYTLKHKSVEAVNLGTGKGTSVLEVVRAFEEASGKKVPYKIVGRRPGDIATCYANTDKARELFGWSAAADIGQMCRDSWNFTVKNPNGIQ
ncbi:MAG: UDP-glucose 4-epimerase GalE [Ruminococcus sp.]|nr:UDP-glucose 4-epimerase GalE [Ruminococcus sp.]MCM1480547.1 UDP-glucose 4-epimerase GalE [Muribaculaceae bacterium]